MEDTRQSHSSMPIVSRLDHLDFVVKYLEGKQSLPKCGSSCSVKGTGRQSMPLDSAVREAYFKGSLMDRIAFLERRLFQLCLEMESSSTSGNSSQTSVYAFSSQESKSEPSFSIPTSNNNIFPNQLHKEDPLAHPNYVPQVKEASCNKEQEKMNSKTMKQKDGKNRHHREEKTCKSRRKRTTPKWSHWKILGC